MIQSLKKLLWEEAATSPTEYALIISLIAASVMLGADAVRLGADSSFRRAATALGVEPAAAASGEIDGNPSDGPRLSVMAASPMFAFAWGVLIAAAVIVGHRRYIRAKARRGVQEIACAPEPLVEVPTNPNFKKRQEIQRILLRHFDDALQSRIEVRHVMSRKVRAVEPSTSLDDLRTLMECEGFHHLLVMQKGALAGVISDRDIRSKKGRQAAHVMTARPLTVSPTTHISQAITAMIQRRISCLPVVEDGQVKGILTTTDMMLSLQCLMQLLERSHASHEPVAMEPGPANQAMASTPIAVAT